VDETRYLVWLRQLHAATKDETGNYWKFDCGTQKGASYGARIQYHPAVSHGEEVIQANPRHVCSNCFTFLRKYQMGFSAE
jgi:hypothetical protein